jgi:hypothetical protein
VVVATAATVNSPRRASDAPTGWRTRAEQIFTMKHGRTFRMTVRAPTWRLRKSL